MSNVIRATEILDFSQEWFDDIDKKIAELYDDIKDFNITASLLAGETIGYLQELRDIKRALETVRRYNK